ncbi:LRR receptor-like serine threonine-protein kinase [Seminavis robusta]|uniref:LRR receptor-like serine threonine-protein kinase n=1 Tax=Seminavis robusta TaxID=568900 RepID=A0A9N8DT45_9STRA|nr:LRR receptor-like serine threonine-protein kinase [Seminavis robusta]|eukprot:Sro337_g120530.1 LRR receptor-like serine threonine-protein kinase (863) ;mRNA; r:12993-15676
MADKTLSTSAYPTEEALVTPGNEVDVDDFDTNGQFLIAEDVPTSPVRDPPSSESNKDYSVDSSPLPSLVRRTRDVTIDLDDFDWAETQNEKKGLPRPSHEEPTVKLHNSSGRSVGSNSVSSRQCDLDSKQKRGLSRHRGGVDPARSSSTVASTACMSVSSNSSSSRLSFFDANLKRGLSRGRSGAEMNKRREDLSLEQSNSNETTEPSTSWSPHSPKRPDLGIMSLPPLQRSLANRRPQAEPGAYPVGSSRPLGPDEDSSHRAATEANDIDPHAVDNDLEDNRNQAHGAPWDTAGGSLLDPQNAGLSVARPVDETPVGDLQQAEELGDISEQEGGRLGSRRRQRKEALRATLRLALPWSIIILLVVLLIVFLVPDTDQAADPDLLAASEPTEAPSMAPSSQESILFSALPGYTIKAMEEEDSPQYQAFRWLLEDPYVYGYPEERIRQRHALMTVFYATAGPTKWFNKTGWGSYSVHECEWYQNQEFGAKTMIGMLYYGFLSGFLEPLPDGHCNNKGIYHHLWLDQNNLEGTLVDELFSLTSLKTLSLGLNSLYGTIPSRIGQLRDLLGLAMFYTGLSGSVPKEIGELSSLEIIFLYDNDLEGSIPDEIWQLSNLDTLGMGLNEKLQGTIPSVVGTLHKLRWLVFDDCDLSGSLPTELGQATSLEWLVLVANNLSGTVPAELGSLSNLWILSLYGNQLVGTLPTELSLLPSLSIMDLRWNALSGSVPSELGLLPSLNILSLNAAQLSGKIPTELANISSLVMVGLGENHFTGGIPSELGMMAMPGMISLENNSLTGTVPSDLTPLQSKLYTLRIEGNPLLSGSIPDPLCTLNGTCIPNSFESCFVSGLLFDCTEQLCGCDCAC